MTFNRNLVLTREQYDRLYRRVLELIGTPADKIDGALDARYDNDGQLTIYTLGECLARGVAASERRLFEFASFHGLPEVRGLYCWTAEAIDAFCQEMETRGFLTGESQERLRQNRTAEDDLQAFERGEPVSPQWENLRRANVVTN